MTPGFPRCRCRRRRIRALVLAHRTSSFFTVPFYITDVTFSADMVDVVSRRADASRAVFLENKSANASKNRPSTSHGVALTSTLNSRPRERWAPRGTSAIQFHFSHGRVSKAPRLLKMTHPSLLLALPVHPTVEVASIMSDTVIFLAHRRTRQCIGRNGLVRDLRCSLSSRYECPRYHSNLQLLTASRCRIRQDDVSAGVGLAPRRLGRRRYIEQVVQSFRCV